MTNVHSIIKLLLQLCLCLLILYYRLRVLKSSRISATKRFKPACISTVFLFTLQHTITLWDSGIQLRGIIHYMQDSYIGYFCCPTETQREREREREVLLNSFLKSFMVCSEEYSQQSSVIDTISCNHNIRVCFTSMCKCDCDTHQDFTDLTRLLSRSIGCTEISGNPSIAIDLRLCWVDQQWL